MNETITDNCYRCGYNLVGIADLQPCPECGLLAQRSRHVSDELHQSRPKWLRKLSWGIWMILLAGLVPIVGTILVNALHLDDFTYFTPSGATSSRNLYYHCQFFPLDLSMLLLFRGFLSLSAREGYPPADKADLLLRDVLRLAPLVPIVALGIIHYAIATDDMWGWRPYDLDTRWSTWIVLVLVTIGCIPMPLLVAFRLRGLAKRAGSAHLAEHCIVVGVGVAFTLLYAFVFAIVFQYADRWGWGTHWTGRGWPSLIMMVVIPVLGTLMVLWSLYLLIRFAIAFGVASRKLRQQWRRDDRSVVAIAL